MDSAISCAALNADEHVADASTVDLTRNASLGSAPAELRIGAERAASLECIVSFEQLFAGVGLDFFVREVDLAGCSRALDFLPAIVFEL